MDILKNEDELLRIQGGWKSTNLLRFVCTFFMFWVCSFSAPPVIHIFPIFLQENQPLIASKNPVRLIILYIKIHVVAIAGEPIILAIFGVIWAAMPTCMSKNYI